MPRAVVFIGLPGSGKSTIRNRFTSQLKPKPFVYSTDDMLDEIAQNTGKTYNDVFHDSIKSVTSTLNTSLDIAIREGRDIVWDQTNLGRKKRASIFQKLKTYRIDCVCIVPPQNTEEEAEWQRRLANRPGKIIPTYVLENMRAQFEVPTTDEGFRDMLLIDMYGDKIE